MANGYVRNPQGPERVAARIRALEKRQDQLDAALKGLGITIDPATNSLVVSSGRAVTVTDVGGNVVAQIGTQPGLERSGGIPQAGVSFYREDGTIAAFLGDANPTVPPFKQSFQIYDRQGNVVVADDTNGGKGLANPYVGGGCSFNDTNVVRWPQTTLGSFTTIADTWYLAENPRVQWDIQHVADAATAGEIRLLCNGTQVDTTQTVGTSFALWSRFNVSLAAAGVSVRQFAHFELQARRTSGTGIVFGIVQRFQGDQTP